jgi:hypothetical protein
MMGYQLSVISYQSGPGGGFLMGIARFGLETLPLDRPNELLTDN